MKFNLLVVPDTVQCTCLCVTIWSYLWKLWCSAVFVMCDCTHLPVHFGSYKSKWSGKIKGENYTWTIYLLCKRNETTIFIKEIPSFLGRNKLQYSSIQYSTLYYTVHCYAKSTVGCVSYTHMTFTVYRYVTVRCTLYSVQYCKTTDWETWCPAAACARNLSCFLSTNRSILSSFRKWNDVDAILHHRVIVEDVISS